MLCLASSSGSLMRSAVCRIGRASGMVSFAKSGTVIWTVARSWITAGADDACWLVTNDRDAVLEPFRGAADLPITSDRSSEVVRFCGGRNIPLCEGPAACRETPASRVLCCRGTGRTASAAFVRDVVWPAGILGGVLRGRRRCLANSSAWPGGSLRRAAQVGGGAREECMVASGRAENWLWPGRLPDDRTHAELRASKPVGCMQWGCGRSWR